MDEYHSINGIFEKFNISKLSNDDQKRIKYLRIPPNWCSVKINKDASSKIQVTGQDSKGRTQYIYHPAWVLFSKDSKYTKVNSIDFNTFDLIIKRYSEFNGTYTKEYMISNMLILMKELNIRVGNEKYLEENDSVGLCTLQKSHYKKEKVKDNDNTLVHKFIFKGKKGIYHDKILKTNHIKFIENIISIPGKSLFKYNITSKENKKDNAFKKIMAEDLNQFLKEYVNSNMTCKDLRTHCANEIFKKEYSKLLNNGISFKKARIEATKVTATELGNTPKVCRDSYIDPSLYSE
jgi:DNA topoisomerase-1